MNHTRRQFLSAWAGVIACRKAAAASADGLLEVSIEARPGLGMIAGIPTSYWGYNGLLPGLRLEARPGDTIRIHFRNSLPEPTNLHFHGLHVPPTGNADNVFLDVPPSGDFDYEVPIPSSHPSGAFWYHPHRHGSASRQVYRGLAGLIIVRGDLDDIPEIAGAREQFMVLQDFTVDCNGQIPEPNRMEQMQGREGSTLLVNGEVNPTFFIERNGLLRCRFLNASSSRYYRLKIEDHPMAILALDGGALPAPIWAEEWLLAPGQRVDLLIAGDRQPGSYRILNLPYNRGSMGMVSTQAPVVLARLDYSGIAEMPVPVPSRLLDTMPLPQPTELRRFILSEGMMGSFQINGKSFSPYRVDTTVMLGAVEDWEIDNFTFMDHPFHVHVNPFQLVRSDGAVESELRDVINVVRGSRCRIRMRFADYAGKTMYHCHILDHEDLGMMGTLEIKT